MKEGIKVLITGVLFVALIGAIAWSDPRVGGDQESSHLGFPEISKVPAEVSAPADEDGEEPEENSDNWASTSVSSSIDISMTTGNNNKGEGDDDGTVEGQAANVGFVMNGDEISCLPGQNYRSDDRSVTCKNKNDNVDVKIRKKDGDGTYKFDISIKQ
jgi:hypothetical protein